MTWMDIVCASVLALIGVLVLFFLWAACWIQNEEKREKEARYAEG